MTDMKSEPFSIRLALLVFAFWITFFAFLLINGYVLNLVGLPANATIILFLLLVEFIFLTRWLREKSMRIQIESLELAGFLLVVAGTWLYFVYASLPTLLPPSYSGDAANHLAETDTVFFGEQIFANYPGGASLIAATVAHWIGWLPIRTMHVLVSFWIALTAGGIYVLACGVLPRDRWKWTIALFAVAWLYVSPGYFAGQLIGANYFSPQVAAQLFVIAFVLFLAESLESRHSFWRFGMALCLIAISVSFQIWLSLPVALFSLMLLQEWRKGTPHLDIIRTMLIVFGLPAIWTLAIILTGGKYFPSIGKLKEFGAVFNPSIEALGGWLLLFPALGIALLRRAGARGLMIGALFLLCVLQTLVVVVLRALGFSSDYWLNKTLFVWIYPLALFSVLPIARAVQAIDLFLKKRENFSAKINFRIKSISASFMLLLVCAVLSAGVFLSYPPRGFEPLQESDISVALWAKEHLDTFHVNYIGTKSISAHWLTRMWDEHLPDDLLIDLPTLGPKTFEAWRNDSDWGEYLLITGNQHFPLDPALRVVYQNGPSAIVQKQTARAILAYSSRLAHFGDALALTWYSLPRQTLHSGDVISLVANIGTLRVPERQIVWRLQLRDLQGEAVAEIRRDPFDNKFPYHRWPDGVIMPQTFTLPLPAELPPGMYNLQLGLYQVNDGEPLRFTGEDGTQDDVMHLGRIKIALPQIPTDELAAIMRVDAKIGDAITLVGYRLKKNLFRPGDTIPLILYWRSDARRDQDFTVFAHLLDSSGNLRAQHDAQPRDGTYPTSIWEPGEIIVDPHLLTIPREALAGDYRIEVGMYQWQNLKRLTVSNIDGSSAGDHIVLPLTIRVETVGP